MSTIIALQTLLDQSASIIEGALRDLEWESEADRVTAETWTHVNNLIYEEMVVVRSHLENAPAVRIRETQQWPPLLELRGTTDSVYAHPWSWLHLLGTAGSSPTKAIERPGPSTAAIPQTVPSAMKVEPGEVEMGDVRSTEKGKGKGKAWDTGDEIVREGKAKGKGKEKEKEVGEDMAVEKSKGKGKGKGKEVVEATVEKGILKNNGKGRESSKDMGQARGRSKSTATIRYKSAEVVPMDSEDEGTGLPPKGPSLTPSSVQDTPWPTCNYCAIKGLVCGPGPGVACCHCKRRKTKCSQSAAQKARVKSTKRGRSASHPPAKSTALRQQSQASPPLKKSQLGELHPVAGLSRPRQERFDGVVMPLPSRSFARSSIPPARQSMQPNDGLSPLPVSKDKEITTLQVVTMQVPLPPLPDVNLRVPITNNPSRHTPSTSPRTSVTPTAPQAPLPGIPQPSLMAVVLPPAIAILPVIPRSSASATQIPSGEAASARVHPPSPESPRLSAPPIAVLSPATTPSSGPDIATTPEVDTRQPSPAAVAAAQPDINMPVDADPVPSALGPMEDVQASPNITIIDIDAVVDIDAAPILVADRMVTAAEAEGDPDPPTTPALPSPQQPAAALQALTATYEDEEDMEVDD
ncbi:hypothetical protein BDN67DRAFT_1017190 [Paxillus ammoniavirescens]|nr:hypothetical protein BDN67DRAFT_1017190 [Paxillus ammoniavirescens]